MSSSPLKKNDSEADPPRGTGTRLPHRPVMGPTWGPNKLRPHAFPIPHGRDLHNQSMPALPNSASTDLVINESTPNCRILLKQKDFRPFRPLSFASCLEFLARFVSTSFTLSFRATAKSSFPAPSSQTSMLSRHSLTLPLSVGLWQTEIEGEVADSATVALPASLAKHQVPKCHPWSRGLQLLKFWSILLALPLFFLALGCLRHQISRHWIALRFWR